MVNKANQQKWESIRSLESAKRNVGNESRRSRRRESRHISSSNIQERRVRARNVFERRLLEENNIVPQSHAASVHGGRRMQRFNAVQMAVGLLYLTAITGLVDGASRELIPRSRREEERKLDNKKNDNLHEEHSQKSLEHTSHQDVTLKSIVTRHAKRKQKKSSIATPEHAIQEQQELTTKPTEENIASTPPPQSQENIPINQEEQQEHIRKKRYLGDLLPRAQEVQPDLNTFFREHYNNFHTILHLTRGAISSNPENIWTNQLVIDNLKSLHSTLKTIITYQEELIDTTTQKLSFELFDIFDLTYMKKSEDYKRTFLDLVAQGDRVQYPHNMRFLSGLYTPQMSVHDKAIGYILLNLLPEHPQVTPHILAQISADIRINVMKNDRAILRQMGRAHPSFVSYVRRKLQNGNNPNVDIKAPLFMDQRIFLNSSFYIGKAYGFCVILSLTFLYNMSHYGPEQGIEKFRDILYTLKEIHSLPYETSLRYARGIKLLAGCVDEVIRVKHLPPPTEFPNMATYRYNVDGKLTLGELADCVFDNNFVRGKNNFYITTHNHALAALRQYKKNTVTGRDELVIYFFDSNRGAFEITDKNTFIDIVASCVRQRPNQPTIYYSISAIEHVSKLKKYKGVTGATLGDFFKNNIKDNKKFKAELVEFESEKRVKQRRKIAKYNAQLPRAALLDTTLTRLENDIKKMQESIDTEGGKKLSAMINGEDIMAKLLSGELFSEIKEELNTEVSRSKLREVSSKITDIAQSVENSLDELSKDKADITKDFEKIQQDIKDIYSSIDEVFLGVDKSSEVKNIAPPSNNEIESNIDATEGQGQYRVLAENEIEGYKGKLYSEADLERSGLYSTQEAVEVKMMMQDLDIALAQLLKDADLDPKKFLAPEVENVKLSATKVEDFDVLLKKEVSVVDVTTGKEHTLSAEDTSFNEKAKLLHNKVSRADVMVQGASRGLSAYCTMMVLTQASSMIDRGQSFHKLKALEKAGYVVGAVDMGLDITANTVGVVNKLYKSVFHPAKSLSRAARSLGKASGVVGLGASSFMLVYSAIEYVNTPNFVMEVEFGFAVTDTVLSVITAAFPITAIVTIPLSIMLDGIKQIIQQTYIDEEQRKQEIKTIRFIIRQLKEEYSKQSILRQYVDVKLLPGGVAVIPNRGDLHSVSFSEPTGLKLSLFDTSGVGYSDSYYPLTYSFPRNSCLSNNKIHKKTVCAWDIKKIKDAPSRESVQRYCDLGYKHGVFALKNKENTRRLLEYSNESKYITRKHHVYQDIQTILISDQLLKVKRLSYYRLAQTIGLIPRLEYSGYRLYAEEDSVHKLMLCSGFKAFSLKSLTWNAKYPVSVFEMPYITGCSIVERRCLHISSQNHKMRTVILSPRRYSSVDEFKKAVEEETQCNVESGIDQYPCTVIHESIHGFLQVYLQGSNKVTIKAHNAQSEHRYGIIFSGEHFTNVEIRDSYNEYSDTVYISIPKSTLRYHDVQVDIKDALEKGVPLYFNSDFGFMLQLNLSPQPFLDVVLYSIDIDILQNSQPLLYESKKALGLGAFIRENLEYCRKRHLPTSIFQVQGVYDSNGERDESRYCTSYFVPRELGGKDRVISLRLSDELRATISANQQAQYELFHVENKYNDYADPDRLKDGDRFTGYFYNAQENMVAIQKGDSHIDEQCLFKVGKEPLLTLFESGNHGVLVQGLAIDYDDEGHPQEVHITDEAIQFRIETIDNIVHTVASLMLIHSSESGLPLGKILLKDIPYKTKEGTQSFIQGYFDIWNQQYILDIKERDGVKYNLLPQYNHFARDMSYSVMYTEDRYILYVSESLKNIADVVDDGVILESKLPELLELFPYVDMKNIVPIQEGIILQTVDNNILLATLEGYNSYTEVVSISKEFMEKYGYSPSIQSEVQSAINMAQLLYGKLIDPQYMVITDNNEEFALVDVSEEEVVSVDTTSFYIDTIDTKKKKVYVKKSTAVPLDVNLEEIYEDVNPLSVTPLGYHTNLDGSKSTYMWSSEADALLVHVDKPTTSNPLRVYQLGVFLQRGDSILVRVDEHHTTWDNVGIVIPGISSVTYQPSLCELDVVFTYTVQELEHIEEVVLDSSNLNGELPTLDFQVPIKKVTVSRFSSKDIRIVLHYQKGEEPCIFNIILTDFFNHKEQYTHRLIINNDTYTSDMIKEAIEGNGLLKVAH